MSASVAVAPAGKPKATVDRKRKHYVYTQADGTAICNRRKKLTHPTKDIGKTTASLGAGKTPSSVGAALYTPKPTKETTEVPARYLESIRSTLAKKLPFGVTAEDLHLFQ